jgi:hypothetical protein
MAQRTNLNTKESSIKYILGSVIFLAISGIGITYLINGKKETKTSENLEATIIPTEEITPTETVTGAKEGEFCGAGTKGVVQCEEGLKCDESKNTVSKNGIERTAIGAGGICVISETATSSAKVTARPTPKTASVSATPTIKETLTFQSKDDAFSVSYDSSRTLYQDKESGGDRFTFYNAKGNIAVHVGQNWSWIYPERVYSNTLLVDGVQTFVYEISNQKIVDFENNGLKYTIQCVHNGLKSLKTECDSFIASFKFI